MSSCRLKSVYICDFKSYKGLVEISNFKQFTAVIGPNGSGKSNFMDAVGFGLGESYEFFRVKNLSELIHGATIKKPIGNSCYVTLEFLLEDESEKRFTRTAISSSNRDKYEINESVVSIDEYQAELNHIGIRDHGKNCLIFQGDIESMAMQNPKERCTFFERVSGSIQFEREYILSKYEMEKARKKVQSTFEQMKILNLEVSILSKESKDAAIFQNLEKEERNLERKLNFFNLFHIEKDIKELDDTFKSNIEDKEIIKRQKSEAKHEWNVLKQGIENEKEILSQMKEIVANREIIFEEKKAICKQLDEKKAFLNKKRDRASKSLADSKKKWDSQKTNIRDLEESKKIVEAKLASYDSQSDSSSPRSLDEQQFQEYNRLKLEAAKRTSLYSQELEPKLRELQKDQDRLDNETRRKTEMSASIQLLTKSSQKIEERINNLKENLETTSNSLIELEKDRDDLKKEIEEERTKLLELQNKNEKLTEYLKNTKYDKFCLERERKKAECIEHLRAHFPDVVGRLIDLCKPIHPRYNLAFIKIFENHADAIVTETATTARECIRFLKDNMLGKEMFIPLDGIEVYEIKQKLREIKDPPNVKLAYDVITFPREIDLAIRFVTKNTLICETVQNAKELSASRQTSQRQTVLGFTCVSLNGTMFKKHGTISGGTSDLIREVKRLDDKNIQKMKLQKQTVEEELKAVLKKVREESRLVFLNSKIEGLQKNNKFIQAHLESVVKEQTELESKLRDLKANEAEISNTIVEIKRVISEKEQAINDIKQQMTEEEDKVFINFCETIGSTNIREYERKDLKMYQEECEKVQQLKDHLNRINNQLEFEKSRDFEGEVSKWKEVVAEVQAELDRDTERKTAVKEEMQKIESELQIERKNLEGKKDEIKDAMKTCRQFENFIATKTEEIKKIMEKLAEINEKKSILKHQIREILQTCQTHELQIPLLSGNLENEEDSVEIDYSDLPEDYKNREDRSKIKENLTTNIFQVQKCLESFGISAPNQKANRMLKARKQNRKIIRQKLREEQARANLTAKKFETVKTRRTDMLISFMSKISNVIDRIYKRLTASDSAQALLMAQNPEEPYLSGIVYTCIAPGKKVLLMEGLSGGEKTIAALALLFAIQKAIPAPFFLLDEVDAALDAVNIVKLANCIRKEKNSMQFIVISLKLKLCCKADALIGVTTGVGQRLQSCIFFLDLEKYEKRV